MHHDECSARIIGGVESSRDVSVYDEDPPTAEDGEWGSLRKGRRRAYLIRQLAAGERTQRQLAAELGVQQPSIARFKKNHAAEIREVKERIADNFAGLWVANKFSRLAAYQEDIELCEAAIAAGAQTFTDDAGIVHDVQGAREWLADKHRALKFVAEELGHLPSKVNLDVSGGVKINYTIEGVDLNALR